VVALVITILNIAIPVSQSLFGFALSNLPGGGVTLFVGTGILLAVLMVSTLGLFRAVEDKSLEVDELQTVG